MEWLNNNKEWLLSGLGATVISGLIALFKPKKEKTTSIGNNQECINTNTNTNVNTNTNTNNNNLTVVMGQSVTKTKEEVLTKISKNDVQILFVDNEKFKIIDNLKKAGYVNTKLVRDITNLDCPDVTNSHIIFVDINGVGKTLFPSDEGLGLAEALKKRYSNKFIVIYSAQVHGDRFHKALKTVDDTLSKNAEPYEFINLIDNFCNNENNA